MTKRANQPLWPAAESVVRALPLDERSLYEGARNRILRDCVGKRGPTVLTDTEVAVIEKVLGLIHEHEPYTKEKRG